MYSFYPVYQTQRRRKTQPVFGTDGENLVSKRGPLGSFKGQMGMRSTEKARKAWLSAPRHAGGDVGMGKGLGTDGMMDPLGGIARQVGRGQEADGLRSD